MYVTGFRLDPFGVPLQGRQIYFLVNYNYMDIKLYYFLTPVRKQPLEVILGILATGKSVTVIMLNTHGFTTVVIWALKVVHTFYVRVSFKVSVGIIHRVYAGIPSIGFLGIACRVYRRISSRDPNKMLIRFLQGFLLVAFRESFSTVCPGYLQGFFPRFFF